MNETRKYIYVIHKHAATHLHYDLRLEMNGVLKSWALPKEPTKYPTDRRLAIAVEDHQVGYEKFEGVIPEGEYGAGKVEIWDSGEYGFVEQTPGKYVIEIRGKIIQGAYCLIKLKPGSKIDKNWLFFKKSDRKEIPRRKSTQKLKVIPASIPLI
ncbi:MAG: DNA polymerase ligase N-terminal domain-containing protein [Candidatus Omnitrophota bacterium]